MAKQLYKPAPKEGAIAASPVQKKPGKAPAKKVAKKAGKRK